MKPGEKVRDYVLEQKVGVGGVGEVWRARHTRLDKQVAIKLIFPHLVREPKARERFIREAKAMAALDHPHIITVHDFFMSEEDAFLVMSYIEGGSLAQVLAQRGRLALDEALQIAREVLEALDFAHKRGIIHRDVKPSNIFLSPDGHAYLGDFGIALLVGEKRLTRTGSVTGTAEYMSPEQIKGEKHMDHRTDVYSLGCVLYEMLTGQPPFGSRDQHVTEFTLMQRHTKTLPGSVRELNCDIDSQTDAVVSRALAKDPDERFAGCAEMAKALVRVERSTSEKRTQPEGHSESGGPDKRGPATGAVAAPAVPASLIRTLRTLKVATGILALSTAVALIGWITTHEDNRYLYDRIWELEAANRSLRAKNSALSKRAAELASLDGRRDVQRHERSSADGAGGGEVERLLREAARAFDALRLTTPGGDNAFDRYNRVLELDPDNRQARRGIQRIAEKYVDLARIRIDAADLVRAETYLDRAAEIDPNVEGLQEARRALAELMAPGSISILDLRLFNCTKSGNRIGAYTQSFRRAGIRYLCFNIRLENDSGREASIGVKYIRPDGTLTRGTDSPAGFTLEFAAASGEGEYTLGWGSSEGGTYAYGTHRLQFWWRNKKLAEKTFEVR